MSSESQARPSHTYAGILFVLLIMGVNLLFSSSPTAMRGYLTRSLRSPNGEVVRSVLNECPAFQVVARTAVMDTESFVRLQVLANYLLLTVFFFYMSFLRGLAPGAPRLSLRLFCVAGVTYSVVLLCDPAPLGHPRSAVQWFQSAGLILAAAVAYLNYLLVRRTLTGRESIHLRVFWGIATAGFVFASLDCRFQLQEGLNSRLRTWLVASASTNTGSLDVLERCLPIGVVAGSLLLLLALRTSLATYRLVSRFDAHKTFALAMLFFALVALFQLAQATGKLEVYLGHLQDLCRSAATVLFLASFAAAASRYAAAHLPTEMAVDEVADGDPPILDDQLTEPMPEPQVRREAPRIVEEADDLGVPDLSERPGMF